MDCPPFVSTTEKDVSPDKKTDFFVVGNPKSGTSILHDYLDQHPDICMSSPKEPNVFATDLCHNVNIGAFQRKSWEEYRSYFDDPSGNQIWGESSACYLYSKDAASNIHNFNPNAKIIAIFREPVSFIYSYHLQQLENVKSECETVKDLEKAINLEGKRKRGEEIPKGCLLPELLYYSERIKYSQQIEIYYRLFGKENVKVLIYDDFKNDNKGKYNDITDFIGTDKSFVPELYEKNKSMKIRSRKAKFLIQKMFRGEGIFSEMKKIIKDVVPKNIRRYVLVKAYENIAFKSKGSISDRLRKNLKKKFRPEVEKFSRTIDRDLIDEWGY